MSIQQVSEPVKIAPAQPDPSAAELKNAAKEALIALADRCRREERMPKEEEVNAILAQVGAEIDETLISENPDFVDVYTANVPDNCTPEDGIDAADEDDDLIEAIISDLLSRIGSETVARA